MTWQRLLTLVALGMLLLAPLSLAMPRDYGSIYRRAGIVDMLFGHHDPRYDMDTAHASGAVYKRSPFASRSGAVYKRSPFTAFCSVGVASWGGLCCMSAPYGGCDCFGESWMRLEFC